MSDFVVSGMKKRRWLWWGGAIAGLLLIAVIVFHAILPTVVRRVTGSILGVPVSIGNVELSVLGNSLVVEDVRISQPEGFGGEPMFELGRLAVDGWLGALFHLRRIDEIRVEKVRFELVSKADGTSNLTALFNSKRAEQDAPATSTTTEVDSADAGMFAIFVNRISMSSVTFVRRNQMENGTEHRLELAGDQITVTRLAIGPVPDVEPGDIEFIGGVVQPGMERAQIYLGGRFSELGTGAENLRVGLRVTGCLFGTLVPMVPSQAGDILGGKGFDAEVDIKAAGGLIDVQGGVVTVNETSYAFAVTGSAAAPEITLPKKLKAVTSRMTGGAGRLFRSAVGGGGELIGGTAKTVGRLGKGTLAAAGNVLKGAGQTAVGVVTVDTEKIKSGAGQATVDAGGDVVDAVGDSAEELANTGGATVGAIGNDPATQEWIAAIPARHAKRIDGLLTGMLAEDFPPTLTAPAESDP